MIAQTECEKSASILTAKNSALYYCTSIESVVKGVNTIFTNGILSEILVKQPRTDLLDPIHSSKIAYANSIPMVENPSSNFTLLFYPLNDPLERTTRTEMTKSCSVKLPLLMSDEILFACHLMVSMSPARFILTIW